MQFNIKQREGMDNHFKKMLNSLIEICVVVGMDQDTGLVPSSSSPKVFVILWNVGEKSGILIKNNNNNRLTFIYPHSNHVTVTYNFAINKYF